MTFPPSIVPFVPAAILAAPDGLPPGLVRAVPGDGGLEAAIKEETEDETRIAFVEGVTRHMREGNGDPEDTVYEEVES